MSFFGWTAPLRAYTCIHLAEAFIQSDLQLHWLAAPSPHVSKKLLSKDRVSL